MEGIHNCPPENQEKYFKTHREMEVNYQSKSVLPGKSAGLLIFTGLLFFCAPIAGGNLSAGLLADFRPNDMDR